MASKMNRRAGRLNWMQRLTSSIICCWCVRSDKIFFLNRWVCLNRPIILSSRSQSSSFRKSIHFPSPWLACPHCRPRQRKTRRRSARRCSREKRSVVIIYCIKRRGNWVWSNLNNFNRTNFFEVVNGVSRQWMREIANTNLSHKYWFDGSFKIMKIIRIMLKSWNFRWETFKSRLVASELILW